jgi:hypothetical protein
MIESANFTKSSYFFPKIREKIGCEKKLLHLFKYAFLFSVYVLFKITLLSTGNLTTFTYVTATHIK